MSGSIYFEDDELNALHGVLIQAMKSGVLDEFNNDQPLNRAGQKIMELMIKNFEDATKNPEKK